MARPRKKRQLESVPEPAIYIPAGWTKDQPSPVEVAIEDFEIMRLVDARGYKIEEAAKKVGVSRSTGGRMLERARRAIAQGIENRSPIYLDASEDLQLEIPDRVSARSQPRVSKNSHNLLAIACHEDGLDRQVGRIFGRAPAFALVSSEGQVLSWQQNPGFGIRNNAAHKATAFLELHGVDRVVAGRFGPEALKLLSRKGIHPFIASGLSIRQAVEIFNKKIS